MTTQTATIQPRIRSDFSLRQVVRERITEIIRSVLSPERWVLLSACDWHPDGAGYPTTLAALAQEDDQPEERI